MHGCRKQLRFRRCHGRAGQKVKSTSENKMENSLVIGICASTTIMHHDNTTNNKRHKNKPNQMFLKLRLSHKGLKTPGCMGMWEWGGDWGFHSVSGLPGQQLHRLGMTKEVRLPGVTWVEDEEEGGSQEVDGGKGDRERMNSHHFGPCNKASLISLGKANVQRGTKKYARDCQILFFKCFKV